MLKNLEYATPQHVFDVLSVYLLVQPKSSRSQSIQHGEGRCLYRQMDGDTCVNMCAAGLLISESDYNHDMESEIISNGYFAEAFRFRTTLRKLIRGLQLVHDMQEDKLERYDAMKDIAREFGLNTVILDNMYTILPGWKAME